MNSINVIFSFFILFCLTLHGKANNPEKIDSLIAIFKNSETDSVQYRILGEIETELNDLDKENEIAVWNSLIEYCEHIEYYKGMGFCYYFLAVRLKIEADYFEALNTYSKSKTYYEKCGYKPGLASVENGFGILYKILKKYELSQMHYKESAKLFMQENDSIRVGRIYLNLGGMLSEQDSLSDAKFYLRESQKLLEKLHDSNIINCYINFGEVFYKEGNPDSAYYYYSKSYKLSKSHNEFVEKFQSSFHLGEFMFEQNRISEAETFLIECKAYMDSPENANQINIEARADFFRLYSKLCEKKGDYKNAYYELLKSVDFELENKQIQSLQEINRQEFENFENQKKQETNRRLWIMYIAIVGFISSLFIMFAFYRGYKHKKEANRLLTEMDELKNHMYSNITHELRTPLTLILGPLELMLSSETEKYPSKKLVKIMRKNANSLLTLVNQMLDLTKIEAKSMKLELVEDDINKFLRTRFAAFASLAEQKSITYQFSPLNEKNTQIFDSSKLEKIINNLISNAVKFTGMHGKISCYANYNTPNTLQLIVEDDGKGIPKNELNKIFDRFHQVKTADEKISFGTGIGLSLTNELVQLMHGKINVESEPGKGSRFTVILPLGIDHLKEDEFNMVQNLSSKTHHTHQNTEVESGDDECENLHHSNYGNINLPHILVVDDHADIRELIFESLNDCFFVEQVENGKNALETAIKNIPDLVITDIVMPEMDGNELCKNLKTNEKTSHIPVVMLTGKSGFHDKMKGLETGADVYLTKPFSIKELRLQVSNLIEQRQKLRERFTRDLRFEPKDISVTSTDEKFITRAMEIIEKNIGNSEFEVRHFEEEMCMSRMQLFRKIKALTNQTPGDFIRTIRLKRAASLIKQNFGNIAQITYEVGFNNPSYFAKCFKDLYGVLPSDYFKNHHS